MERFRRRRSGRARVAVDKDGARGVLFPPGELFLEEAREQAGDV